jgi:Ca2+-binding EF-hand superfamily protein
MNTTARIKDRLCVILKQRGVRGLSGLLQAFRDADQSKNGYLSWEEFCTYVLIAFSIANSFIFYYSALQRCGLAPSPQDLRALFLEFDKDGSNEISFQEFVSALRVRLN